MDGDKRKDASTHASQSTRGIILAPVILPNLHLTTLPPQKLLVGHVFRAVRHPQPLQTPHRAREDDALLVPQEDDLAVSPCISLLNGPAYSPSPIMLSVDLQDRIRMMRWLLQAARIFVRLHHNIQSQCSTATVSHVDKADKHERERDEETRPEHEPALPLVDPSPQPSREGV